MRFDFCSTPLAGLTLVQRQRYEDSRGFLSRVYCAEEFAGAGICEPIVQINHTLTRQKGCVRGMHFQRPPHAEMKFVSCLAGEVFDVAVDLRPESTTYLHWYGTTLSATNHKSLLIPPGFAHGFQALVDDCELLYLHTAAYHPESECAVNALDPALAIAWPLVVTEMSERDRSHAFLAT